MPRYEVGDAVVLETQVSDADGNLADATVALTLTRPDGTPGPSVTVNHPSTGIYRAAFVLDALGTWTYRWETSGTLISVETGTVSAREPAVMLCDVEDVPGWAELDREDVKRAIIGASARVAGYVGQTIAQRQHHAAFYAGSVETLTLPQGPVQRIDSLKVDGITLAAGTLDGSTYGYVRSGRDLMLPWSTWWGRDWSWALVEIDYTAGYDVVPDDLVDLVADMVASRVDGTGKLRQYTIGRFSATVATESLEGSGWTADQLDVLNRYRRRGRTGVGILRVGR